jgi:hypothetical protein
LGEIPLRKFVELQNTIDSESEKKANGFGVVTSDRTFYLIADTPEEKDEWMEVIHTLGTLYKLHFALSSRVGETPRAQLVKARIFQL